MRGMRRVLIGSTLAFAALGAIAGPAVAAGKSEVYTSSNATSGNRVLAFERAGNGSLRPDGSFATGGNGTGANLGSQGAIALTDGGRTLYSVNAGSNSISTFDVGPRGLRLEGITASRGDQPISLTERDGLLYALNAGSGTISGFRAGHSGRLIALRGSTRPISGAGPAEVAFSNDGDRLVVTNKNTNTIDTFAVGRNGLAGPAQSHPSEGTTPFGFDFDRRGHLIVSEAAGGVAGASSLSSYSVERGFSNISASIGDNQTSACWVKVSKDERIAFTTNTGSGTISSYSVGRDGTLGLLEQIAANTGTGSAPGDMAQSASGRLLFALLPGSGSVAAYRVHGGGLTTVDQVGGLPASVAGLAAN